MTTSYNSLGEKQTMATEHIFLSGPEDFHLSLGKPRRSTRLGMATSFCFLSCASGVGGARESKGNYFTPESYKSYKYFKIIIFSNYTRT